jgi:hypothetical protein
MKQHKSLYSALLGLAGVVSCAVAYAAPPPAPQLHAETQGLEATLSWSPLAEATGYRLFFANYPDGGDITSVDLGLATSISKTLWDGAAFYVAVSAYNADGNGAYSNVEWIQTTDLSQIDPENLPLTVNVEVDTPIAFLPEAEAERTARRRAEESSDLSMTEVYYGEGLIGMTLHIAPDIAERENLPLSFCLDVGQVCQPLLVWNSEAQEFIEGLHVSKVYTDVETSLYLELKLPDDLIETLRPQLTQPQSFTIRTTLLNSSNTANVGVALAQLALVDLPPATRSERRTPRNNIGMKFGREYSKKFGGRVAGIEFGVKGQALIYHYKPKKEKESDPEPTPRTGATVTADGSVKPTVFTIDFTLLSSDAYFIIEDEHPLHFHFDIKAINKEIALYIKDFVYDTNAPNKFRELTADEAKKAPTPPSEKDLKSMTMIDIGSQSKVKGNLLSAKIGGLVPKLEYKKGYEKIFFVGWVPLTLKLEAVGKLELAGAVGIRLNETSQVVLFAAGVGPAPSVGVSASAAVDFVITSAGVEAELTLIKNVLGVDADLPIVAGLESGKSLRFALVNDLQGPSGKVEAFVTYPMLVWKRLFPEFETRKSSTNIVKWESFSKKTTLYELKLDGQSNNSDIDGTAKNDEPKLPEFKFTDAPQQTRPDNETPWACFYQHVDFQGKSLCLPLSKDIGDGSVNFPLAAGVKEFNDQISSIKLWGSPDFGIELRTFEHADYTGDQMIYVTHGEEQHANFGKSHPHMNLNDHISSIVLRKALPRIEGATTQNVNSLVPPNTEPWGAGICLWEHINYEGSKGCTLNGVEMKDGGRPDFQVKRNQASSLKAWAALGDFDVYLAQFLSTSGKIVEGNVIGIRLDKGEQVAFPTMGSPGNKHYLNDDLVAVLVRLREGQQFDWVVPRN